MKTWLCRPGHWIGWAKKVATLKWVQTMTTAIMISQGNQPCHAGMWRWAELGSSAGTTSWNSGSGAGCHTRRNSTVAISEEPAEITSVSS